MKRIAIVSIAALSAVVFCAGRAHAQPKAEAMKNWPAWRGPLSNGVVPNGKPPTEWSEEKNIRWKVAIPGKGHATPIIWGDRIYLQTAIETEKPAAKADDSSDEAAAAQALRAFDAEQASALLHVQPQDPDRPRRGPGGRRGEGGRRGPGRGDAPTREFEFQVIALDRTTGKTICTKTARKEAPHESGHTDSTQASNSPVTDGKHIYAFFGSRGLHCLDMDGNIKWQADFGRMKTRNEFGEGSSPALYGDAVIVNWDHEGDDFIVALNKKTGKELWRVERDEPTSWSTPIVVEAGETAQVIVNATNFIRAYDIKNGKELWRASGMTGNTIPTPIPVGDMVYCLSGFRGAAAFAIRYGAARGDITEDAAIVWKYDRDTPYVPTGVVYNDRLYFVENNRPILTCLSTKNGKPVYDKQRLSGVDMIYASFLAADGKIYIAGRNGATLVLKDGPDFEVLATNQLDDGFDASPAVAGNELFLRGRSHLYCIAAK